MLRITEVEENTDWMFDTGWDFSSDSARVDVCKWIDKKPADKFSILDVGCASGKTLKYLKETFPKAKLYGIEPDSKLAGMASEYGDIAIGSVENYLKVPHMKFDYILFSDVLEHLLEPWTVLRDMGAFLKAGGKVLASIPNVEFIAVIISLLRSRFCYGSKGIVNKQHLRFFTLTEIIQMFDACGYTSVEYTYNTAHLEKEVVELIEFLEKSFGKHKWKHYDAYQYVIRAER